MLDLLLQSFPEDLRAPIWYVLAGFILGFAVSTLWEWLYFRRYRIEDIKDARWNSSLQDGEGIAQQETPLYETRRRPEPRPSEFEPATPFSPYRAAGVFLERERPTASSSAGTPTLSSTSVSSSPLNNAPISNTQPTQPADSVTTIGNNIGARVKEAAAYAGRIPTQSVNPSTSNLQPKISDRLPVEGTQLPTDSFSELAPILVVSAGTSEPLAKQLTEPAILGSITPSTNTTFATEQAADQPVIPVQDDPLPEALVVQPTARSSTNILPTTGDAVVIAKPLPARQRQVPRSLGYPDDLSLIKGIGNRFKQRLYEAHIYTFHHVATSDVEVLRQATKAAPYVNIELWPVQARTLAEKNGRTNASYSGPLPDDLTKIPGIYPASAQLLYRYGICTYAQLADTTVEELSNLFARSNEGATPTNTHIFQAWLNAAQQRVAEEQAEGNRAVQDEKVNDESTAV